MPVLDVKTKVGNLFVVSTGVAHLHGAQNLEIDINGYTCSVRFVSDGGGPRYEGAAVGTSFLVTCYNHFNHFGEAIFTPFAVGQIAGKTIYMTYFTNLIDPAQGVRRFEYSLWMES